MKTIAIEVDHLGTLDRLEAAVWCMEEFGPERVDVMRPLGTGTDLKAAFWFRDTRDANWFALRWL
jgi:hypothetical protein